MVQKIKDTFSLFTQKEDTKEVYATIEANIPFRGTNLWILIFAIFIASLGLNVNSTAVIIGAMLISPLMGPIMGIGFSLAINKPQMLKLSLQNYLLATIIGLVTSTLYFFVSPLSEAHSEILARTSPNIYDVLIAFFGGCAGMLANGSKLKGNVIPGVAIATALMPPLCTAGYGLATSNYQYTFGALYLYIINTVFIAVATLLMVRILDFPKYIFPNSGSERKWRYVMTVLILLTLIPSIWFGYRMILKNEFEHKANRFITSDAVFPNNFLLAKHISFEKNTIELTYGGEKLSKKDFADMIQKAEKYGLQGTNVIIKQGFNFHQKPNELRTENPALVAEKNLNKVIKLQDSISAENRLAKEIYSELKTTRPYITAVSYSIHRKEGEEALAENQKTGIVYINENISEKDSGDISAYIKTRLKAPTAKILFVQE